MEDENNLQSPYLVSPKVFHLEMPLYHTINIEEPTTRKAVYDLMHYSGTIDAYCIYCEKESVFDTYEHYSNEYAQWIKWGNGFERITYRCTRDNNHEYYTYHLKTENSIQKIGQFPSVASFQIPQAEKYRKILGKNRYEELVRGISLKAHGVGIGSFVYLRRVFASLIDEALTEYKEDIAKTNGKFSEGEYLNLRMDERINFLKEHLPKFLVENRIIYSILSKGIHELTEEECLEYFDAVKIGIEQILDEKLLLAERIQKAKLAREGIQNISQKVKK